MKRPARRSAHKRAKAENIFFRGVGTRKGRGWFKEAHKKYATARKPESMEEVQEALRKEEERRREQRRMAQRIARIDKRTREEIRRLKRAKLAKAVEARRLSSIWKSLKGEEARLEKMERRVSKRDDVLAAKQGKWVKKREKEVKGEMRLIEKRLRGLGK